MKFCTNKLSHNTPDYTLSLHTVFATVFSSSLLSGRDRKREEGERVLVCYFKGKKLILGIIFSLEITLQFVMIVKFIQLKL